MSQPNRAEAPSPIIADLLGQVRLRVGERELADRACTVRGGRSLLLLLLITPGHELTRERVLTLLWPHRLRDPARNACAKALHALRRALEPDSPTGRYLIADRARIALAPAVELRIDADDFAAAVTNAPPAAAGGRAGAGTGRGLRRRDRDRPQPPRSDRDAPGPRRRGRGVLR